MADMLSIAKSILDKYPIRTIRENSLMFIYNNEKGHYMPNADTYLGRLCVLNIKDNAKPFYSELIFYIRQLTYININDFESDPNYINLKNGVLDVANNKLLKFDPKFNFKYNLDIEFNDNSECPLFEKMVRTMTKSKEDYDLLQRWFGYHFYKSTSRVDKKSLFIVGPPDAGKSTLFWVLQKINGDGNYTTHSLKDIANDNNKYYIADLYGKLANINADISMVQPKDISIFKQLTGGDPITGRKIRGAPFKFLNHSKFSFACNYLPFIREPIYSDKAFWNRIMAISVQKCYEEEDKYIKDKLKNELSGILNWAIKGFKDYIKFGFDIYKNSWEETRKMWTENMGNIDHSVRERESNRVDDSELLELPNCSH